MRVVLEHLLGELSGHGVDNVLGLTGFEQVRDDRMAQVVEPCGCSIRLFGSAKADRRPLERPRDVLRRTFRVFALRSRFRAMRKRSQ